ncbi:MAG: DUF4468 domain-containing protein [Bacteroidales bacterium]|nr:DUF4468 domain-containing protein [Bacteroidales bacterium]
MKKLLLSILVLLNLDYSYCQDIPIDDKTGKITYEAIESSDSLNKDEIYLKTLEWFALSFSSSNDVIQLKDKDAGKVIGKGNFMMNYYSRNPTIFFTITIMIKDGRYKIVITDLKYLDIQGDEFNLESFPKSWAGKKKLYSTLDMNVKSILNDYKSHINNLVDEDDW